MLVILHVIIKKANLNLHFDNAIKNVSDELENSENKKQISEKDLATVKEMTKNLPEKIKEIEEKYNCTVYAVTHEYTHFGECYSLMIVTDYPEEWEHSLTRDKSTFYAFAYVWNKDDDWCSEFGTIGVKSFGGGITRVA